MPRIPDGKLPPEVANDPHVLCRKAGLTDFHARVLIALERIAGYYDALPQTNAERRAAADSRKGASHA